MLFSLLSFGFAFDHSHAAFQAVLSARLYSGRVDYAAIKADPAPLDAYLGAVATADVGGMTAAQSKAFYINAYNALTIDLIADNYPLVSILTLDFGKVWDKRSFLVAGQQKTLNDIEHRILRPLGDARIHAAVNCASVGCPPLAAWVFTADKLDKQLDGAATAWVAGTVVSGSNVAVTKIFDWYGDDFLPAYGMGYFDIPGVEGKAEATLNFIAAFSPALAPTLRAGGLTVSYQNYDWSVNGRK